eukprot:178813_1
MSWFGKGKSNDKARKRHVQSLMSRNGRLYTATLQNKNSYLISFKTRMGVTSFVISLPEQFPESPPRLYCDAKYSHPWLDQSGTIIGIDELNRWSSQYSDLGRIVHSAVMQFTASPPTLTNSQMSSSAYQPIQPVQPSQPPPSYQQHQKLKKTTSVLDMQTIKFSIPQTIDKLEQLSPTQIDEMVKEPKLIEEFAYSVASGLREMRDQQQNEILRIARSNIAKKEEILTKDREVKELRQEIDTLSTIYKDLKARQEKELQKFSKQRLNKELNKAIEDSDDQTTQIKDKFDEGDMAPVAFIKKYIRERAKYHTLLIKKEKLNIF